jgi:hypothetical protein
MPGYDGYKTGNRHHQGRRDLVATPRFHLTVPSLFIINDLAAPWGSSQNFWGIRRMSAGTGGERCFRARVDGPRINISGPANVLENLQNRLPSLAASAKVNGVPASAHMEKIPNSGRVVITIARRNGNGGAMLCAVTNWFARHEITFTLAEPERTGVKDRARRRGG